LPYFDEPQVTANVRVLQISDTHLSAAKRHFLANWPPLAGWISRQAADVTIHTGDLTVDGADVEDDIRHCGELLRALPGTVLAVPGNHDVGEAHHPRQPVDATRLDRWRRIIGPDWWLHDDGQWRLIGIDSMLFGSDTDDERRQFEWLQSAHASAGSRRIAWFTHRPLFLDAPDEPDTGYWSVKPAQRAPLLDLVRGHDVAIVASGHLHRWRDARFDRCRYIWCPSSGFLVGPENQPDMPGEKWLGAVVYDFDDSDVSVRFADVSGLAKLWIDDVLDDVYPHAVRHGTPAVQSR
jgi:3',5'-cyclic AMP phosphodiesterase CpdA